MITRLSQIIFLLSMLSTFAGLWVMNLNIIPRDTFSWGLVIFSFLMALMSGGWSLTK